MPVRILCQVDFGLVFLKDLGIFLRRLVTEVILLVINNPAIQDVELRVPFISSADGHIDDLSIFMDRPISILAPYLYVS
jgi:hypothetical protein